MLRALHRRTLVALATLLFVAATAGTAAAAIEHYELWLDGASEAPPLEEIVEELPGTSNRQVLTRPAVVGFDVASDASLAPERVAEAFEQGEGTVRHLLVRVRGEVRRDEYGEASIALGGEERLPLVQGKSFERVRELLDEGDGRELVIGGLLTRADDGTWQLRPGRVTPAEEAPREPTRIPRRRSDG